MIPLILNTSTNLLTTIWQLFFKKKQIENTLIKRIEQSALFGILIRSLSGNIINSF